MTLPIVAIVVAVARGLSARPGDDGAPYHRWSPMSHWQEFGDPETVVISIVIPTLESGDVFARYGFPLPDRTLEKTDPAEYARQLAIAEYANDALVRELDEKLGCSNPPAGPAGNRADFNRDGVVNSSDFFDFLQAFVGG